MKSPSKVNAKIHALENLQHIPVIFLCQMSAAEAEIIILP